MYYKQSGKWIKGVDYGWIPYSPTSSSKGVLVGVEGEKCVYSLYQQGITAFTFASHCWEEKYMTKAIKYLLSTFNCEGILYIADNDLAGIKKAKKLELVARKERVPCLAISTTDIWYYVTDDFCFKSADIADLLEKEKFNLKQLLCSTIKKLGQNT